MTTLINDIKYGLRMLIKNRGLTVTIALVLALGIGANSALFSVIQSVLLSPLPFREPERLVLLHMVNQASGNASACSGPDYLDWIEQSTVFEDLCAFNQRKFTLTGAGDPITVTSLGVTPSFLRTLKASLYLGGFQRDEFTEGDHNAVVLSHQLWRDRFGADPNILGKEITLDASSWRVVGVAQRTMGFLEDFAQVHVTMQNESLERNRGHRYLTVLGRLKGGVSVAQAQAELDLISDRLSQTYVATNKDLKCTIFPLHEVMVSTIRTAFLIVYGAVGLVLVIACANVSNLLLAKSGTRSKEIAVRHALGAGRGCIMQQMLTESILLALLGGGLGVVLGQWGLHGLRLIAPKAAQSTGGHIPGFDEVGLNPLILGFTLALSVLTGVLFGLVPAWKGSRVAVSESLKEGAQSASQSVSSHRTLNVLVVFQIALAVVLLVSAGLLIRSYDQLNHTHLGFDPDNMLAVRLERTDVTNTPTLSTRMAFFQELVQRLEDIPGIESACATTEAPLSYNCRWSSFRIDNRPPPLGEQPRSGSRVVTPGFFQCVGILVLSGREFAPTDDDSSKRVVVVNEAFVHEFFPQEEPLGRLITCGDETLEIVGVVGNVKTHGLQPEAFVPLMYRPLGQEWLHGGMTVLARTAGDPQGWVAAVKSEIWDIDSTQPIAKIQTMKDIAADSVSVERFCMILLVLTAGLALLISLVGLYGIVSFTVNERRNEIGIRMALGADRRNVFILVMKNGIYLIVMGLVIGLAGALAVTRCLSSIIYQTNTTDTMTLLLVSIALPAVALLACYIPARRAAKIDPMEALRYE